MDPKICENCKSYLTDCGQCDNPESMYFLDEVSIDFSCLRFEYKNSK